MIAIKSKRKQITRYHDIITQDSRIRLAHQDTKESHFLSSLPGRLNLRFQHQAYLRMSRNLPQETKWRGLWKPFQLRAQCVLTYAVWGAYSWDLMEPLARWVLMACGMFALMRKLIWIQDGASYTHLGKRIITCRFFSKMTNDYCLMMVAPS